MTRIMFPFLLLVALAAQVMGVLNADQKKAWKDLTGSAEYKAYLVGVLLRRAFERAYQEAIGGNAGDAARGRGIA